MTIELFIGMPGTGKSMLMQYRVKELVDRGWKCFVSDIVSEWSADSWRWGGNPPKIHNAQDIISDIEGVEGGCIIRFDDTFPRLEAATVARRHANCFYVDDELDMVATTGGWHENPLKDFVHRGRHLRTDFGVREGHILGAARRLQYMATDLTGMADTLNIFRLRGKPTVKRIEDEGWLFADQLKYCQNMPNLHFFQCVAQSDEKPRKFLIKLPPGAPAAKSQAVGDGHHEA
jgi:hypothetical protein